MSRGSPGRVRLAGLGSGVAVAILFVLTVSARSGAGASGASFTMVASGFAHSCAVTTASGAQCWGDNRFGELGDGRACGTTCATPVDVCMTAPAAGATCGNRLLGVARVASGYNHSCALLTSGGVRCWGSNFYGELGNGTRDDSPTPVDVCAPGAAGCTATNGNLSGVVAISVGFFHTCALTAAGGVQCWGGNHFGQLGDGRCTSGCAAGGPQDCSGESCSTTPVDVCASSAPACTASSGNLTGVIAIATSSQAYHTCALRSSGGGACWGLNDHGQLGSGTPSATGCQCLASPVDVCTVNTSGPACAPADVLTGISAIAAGGGHSCAVTTVSGAVRCWGTNASGQLGGGTTSDSATPAPVCATGMSICTASSGQLEGAAAVTAGLSHTCALSLAGGLKCWGAGALGELGNGSVVGRSMALDVAGLASGVADVSAGGYHTCAITAGGEVKCWGANDQGQLGTGTSIGPASCGGVACSTSPVDVSAPTKTARGDVNCDGRVDAIDAALILQVEARLISSLACGQEADVNGDGRVNAIDAALILQYSAGLVPGLPQAPWRHVAFIYNDRTEQTPPLSPVVGGRSPAGP